MDPRHERSPVRICGGSTTAIWGCSLRKLMRCTKKNRTTRFPGPNLIAQAAFRFAPLRDDGNGLS